MGILGDCVSLDRNNRGGCGTVVIQDHGGHH